MIYIYTYKDVCLHTNIQAYIHIVIDSFMCTYIRYYNETINTNMKIHTICTDRQQSVAMRYIWFAAVGGSYSLVYSGLGCFKVCVCSMGGIRVVKAGNANCVNSVRTRARVCVYVCVCMCVCVCVCLSDLCERG